MTAPDPRDICPQLTEDEADLIAAYIEADSDGPPQQLTKEQARIARALRAHRADDAETGGAA